MLRYLAPEVCPECGSSVKKDQRLGGFAYGLGADQRTYNCGLQLRFHRVKRKDIEVKVKCPVAARLEKQKRALKNKLMKVVSGEPLPKAYKTKLINQLLKV